MNLREKRKEKGLTQKELSAMCGINQNTVSRYETETRQPRLKDAQALAKALDCTIDELIGSEEESAENRGQASPEK